MEKPEKKSAPGQLHWCDEEKISDVSYFSMLFMLKFCFLFVFFFNLRFWFFLFIPLIQLRIFTVPLAQQFFLFLTGMPAPAEKGVELLPKTTEIQSRHYRFNSICMKPFYLLLTAMLTWLSLIPIAQAQTAEGGCTSVELIDGVPSYPNNAYIDPYLVGCGYCNGCNKMLNPQYYQSPKTAQFLLQILDGESWSNVGGWQTSSEFDDIEEHGWYRVAVRVPQYLSAFCTGGWIKIYNYLDQHVGYEGEWATTIYSNMVTVGETEQSDVTWEFIDPTLTIILIIWRRLRSTLQAPSITTIGGSQSSNMGAGALLVKWLDRRLDSR
ncbi:MAG: hypothetical protein IPH04_09640 [Saprospirales bacterium]|nr:hypothetical protein [Saprospirales bacterium]